MLIRRTGRARSRIPGSPGGLPRSGTAFHEGLPRRHDAASAVRVHACTISSAMAPHDPRARVHDRRPRRPTSACRASHYAPGRCTRRSGSLSPPTTRQRTSRASCAPRPPSSSVLAPDAHRILIVDDNSPGRDRRDRRPAGGRLPQVEVLHRADQDRAGTRLPGRLRARAGRAAPSS